MNYTKGEWIVTDTLNYSSHKVRDIVIDGGILIARIFISKNNDMMVKEDNARLISAAPILHGQLLTGVNALREALDCLNKKEIDEATDYIRGVVAGNEMALAKAEGK